MINSFCLNKYVFIVVSIMVIFFSLCLTGDAAEKKIIGFHIDMNMANYRSDYLKKWLRELADCGFNTILWEVENKIAWETCPECVAPEAFTKDEFREILSYGRVLGLEPVPLLQTIGHAQYVLKHEKYHNLKELPDRIDQYCPTNPDLVPFLHRWIQEYLDVFGDIQYFHIGADEAWTLGSCPRCKAFTEKYSLSRLYIDHVNAVAEPIIKRGITPIIWADMVLSHSEALDELSRDIMLFDWMYNIYRGNGKVWVWGKGLKRKEDLSDEILARFGSYLFPHGDEPGREPETFYTADFLSDNGFRVVTCPGSRSFRDNVFSSRNYFHMINTFDSFKKGMNDNLGGSLLTSWSWHLFPWELQRACIQIPGFLHGNPAASIEDFQARFMRDQFGIDDESFFRACGLLSKSCLFTYSGSLGYSQACLPVEEDHIINTIRNIRDENSLEQEINRCRECMNEYRHALHLFEALEKKAKTGKDLIEIWKLSARNLIERAEAVIFLLEHSDEVIGKNALTGKDGKTAKNILLRTIDLRQETKSLYQTIVKPHSATVIVTYMYNALEQTIAGLAGE